jgi:phage FluMu gp28-like protein
LASRPLPAVLQLRPYQQRWIDDPADSLLAVKAARVGFSYATGLRRLLKKGGLLERENRTVTVLSASKPQSVEFVETVQKNLQLIGATAQLYEEPFIDIEGESTITQSRIQLPNGCRYIALAANPRTARGYPGDAILDEFGHHEDSYSIWAAITRQTALGNEIDVLSTPNGEQGKYFNLAKELGLTDGVAPSPNPKVAGTWSAHWVDVHLAVAEGCPIDIEKMRNRIKDEDTFQQEFMCVFLQARGAWLPVELIAAAEDDAAGPVVATGEEALAVFEALNPTGPIFGGIDVGRVRDATLAWFDEKLGDVAWARLVLRLHNTPFPRQHDILAPLVARTTRTAMDATGMGIALYDYLNKSNPGKVMGVSFAGTNDQGVKLKTDLAVRIKRNFEKGRNRIPRDRDIRQELMAIKREATSSGVTFDAPRIELDSAVAGGPRKKVYSHAEAFWAKALADLAAESAPAGMGIAIESQKDWYHNNQRGVMTRQAQEISGRDREEEVAINGGGRRSLWGSR